jgi:hypothetical protein
MSETQDRLLQKRYRVCVGLAECTVSCRSEQEAIEKARRQLNQEMPKLAGVIRGIQDKEFRVDQVG